MSSPEGGGKPAVLSPNLGILTVSSTDHILEWHEAINQFQPYVFRISTPDGFGTGFLVSRRKRAPLCAIATAAHVIRHAHYWEQPVRLDHPASGKTVLLHPSDRAITLSARLDTASLTFAGLEFDLPDEPLPLIDKGFHLKPGVEIGWMGFPAIPRAELCFFSGRVSAYLERDAEYLVDGVAINGVSGGPAFCPALNTSELIGVVSAYIPNVATGDVLPGVAVVLDVMEYHDLAERFRSLDEAKAQETPPSQVPPQTQTPDEPGTKTRGPRQSS